MSTAGRTPAHGEVHGLLRRCRLPATGRGRAGAGARDRRHAGRHDRTGPWVTAQESREQLVGLYHRARAHAAVTIDLLPLDAPGEVPWWPPEHRTTTLHRILVHAIAETERHAGHADILRELIDRAVGVRAGSSGLPEADASWWADYRDRLERVAREAAGL